MIDQNNSIISNDIGGYSLDNVNLFRMISKISEGVADNYEKIIEHEKKIAELSTRVDTLEQKYHTSIISMYGYNKGITSTYTL